jgi:hypothetical protein
MRRFIRIKWLCRAIKREMATASAKLDCLLAALEGMQ